MGFTLDPANEIVRFLDDDWAECLFSDGCHVKAALFKPAKFTTIAHWTPHLVSEFLNHSFFSFPNRSDGFFDELNALGNRAGGSCNSGDFCCTHLRLCCSQRQAWPLGVDGAINGGNAFDRIGHRLGFLKSAGDFPIRDHAVKFFLFPFGAARVVIDHIVTHGLTQHG